MTHKSGEEMQGNNVLTINKFIKKTEDLKTLLSLLLPELHIKEAYQSKNKEITQRVKLMIY